MSQNEESPERGQKIAVKRCPRCTKIITNCARYGNVIKKQTEDMIGIRNKIFGNNRTQMQMQQIIADKIERQSKGKWQFENVREFLERRIYQMKEKGRKVVMDLQNVSGVPWGTSNQVCELQRLFNNFFSTNQPTA